MPMQAWCARPLGVEPGQAGRVQRVQKGFPACPCL